MIVLLHAQLRRNAKFYLVLNFLNVNKGKKAMALKQKKEYTFSRICIQFHK